LEAIMPEQSPIEGQFTHDVHGLQVEEVNVSIRRRNDRPILGNGLGHSAKSIGLVIPSMTHEPVVLKRLVRDKLSSFRSSCVGGRLSVWEK
jgi:hypothetical protein